MTNDNSNKDSFSSPSPKRIYAYFIPATFSDNGFVKDINAVKTVAKIMNYCNTQGIDASGKCHCYCGLIIITYKSDNSLNEIFDSFVVQ